MKGCIQLEIIQITEKEISHIASLFDAYRVFYEQKSNVEAAKDFVLARVQNHESILFAAIIKNEFVGFTQLYPTFSSVAMKKAFILNDLFVAENHRKKGVAQALMNHAFKFAANQDARFIALETGANNQKAQVLYEKMNMVIENDVKHYIHYW